MSTIFISNIVGDGVFVVSENDSQLFGAGYFMNMLLSGVHAPAGLTYETVRAWVKDSGRPGGLENARTLNCQISGVKYNDEECPDASEIDTLTAAIEASLLSSLEPFGTIESIGLQEFNLVQYFPID
jgi:hypothetical protein